MPTASSYKPCSLAPEQECEDALKTHRIENPKPRNHQQDESFSQACLRLLRVGSMLSSRPNGIPSSQGSQGQGLGEIRLEPLAASALPLRSLAGDPRGGALPRGHVPCRSTSSCEHCWDLVVQRCSVKHLGPEISATETLTDRKTENRVKSEGGEHHFRPIP